MIIVREQPAGEAPDRSPRKDPATGHATLADSESADSAFLGEEFLTWLWWHIETCGGTFELNELGEVGVAFDRQLEFRDDLSGARSSVRADAVTHTPEAHAALSTGKLPSRARLVIGWRDLNVEVTIDGTTLDLVGLKAPRPRADDRREEDEEAAGVLETAALLVRCLFTEFLQERLAPDFESRTLRAMRAWVAARASHGGLPATGPAPRESRKNADPIPERDAGPPSRPAPDMAF